MTRHRLVPSIALAAALATAAVYGYVSTGCRMARPAATPISRAEPDVMERGTAAEPAEAPMANRCPTAVPGTRIDVEDTADGVALEFTTLEGDVQEVRRRVRMMAEEHAAHAAHHRMEPTAPAEPIAPEGGTAPPEPMPRAPEPPYGTAAPAPEAEPGTGAYGGMEGHPHEGMHGMKKGEVMMDMPATRAEVQEIEAGARLVLRPVDERQMSTLREKAREHARRMERGECPYFAEEEIEPAS